ncbi:MAG: carbohydrate-binding protein [Microbacteriaceae bacterium]|nr:carbohydrate-binding protein [Microbacteriaceae bacterium]MCL2793929.1 carbohydrate-binding protein [Microbacteriaceae bacterium]
MARPGRISPFRVVVAVLVPLVVIAGGAFGYVQWQANADSRDVVPWFAPYVDVTATPQYAFENLASTHTEDSVLSFVVAASATDCTPSWGGVETLGAASGDLDLDRRIARTRQQGGDIAVSFGGQANTELALACTSADALQRAYAAVLDRYDASTADFDIEGDAISDTASVDRRAEAVARLQQQRRDAGDELAVWLTLPATPDGLTPDGQAVVTAMLSAGVDLAGVNVMTMNYGESLPAGTSMLEGSEQALTQTHRQLGILYQRHHTPLTSATLWRKIGATPMIGQNDVAGETFTLGDAVKLNAFARQQGIGRMSMWSANRDRSCSANYVDVTIVSDACSGVAQGSATFAATLGKGFSQRIALSSRARTTAEPVATQQPTDDPATSPYQIWSPTGAYPAGTKVVWRRNVYQAKWWTQGDAPDNPVLNTWETPWTLIGPVLPGETPIPQPTVPAGLVPAWNPATAYKAGTVVELDGVPYQAKWWTQGDSPDASQASPDSSPWVALTSTQIQQLIADAKGGA